MLYTVMHIIDTDKSILYKDILYLMLNHNNIIP